MRSPKKQYEDDDGRVIVSMDVEGMPMHNRSIRREKIKSVLRNVNHPYGSQMSRSEARQYTRYSLLAAFSIVAIFSATWILFTLFCIKIWFR